MFQALSFPICGLKHFSSLPPPSSHLPHFFPAHSISCLRPGLQLRTWFWLSGSESQNLTLLWSVHPSGWHGLRVWCLCGSRATLFTHAVTPPPWNDRDEFLLSKWLVSFLTSGFKRQPDPVPILESLLQERTQNSAGCVFSHREAGLVHGPSHMVHCFLLYSQKRLGFRSRVIASSGHELNPSPLPLLFWFLNFF